MFKVTQFGGKWGSNAGDCCVITYGSKPRRHAVIDLGSGDPAAARSAVKGRLDLLVLTHMHEDHTSSDPSSFIAKAKGDGGRVVLPAATASPANRAELAKYKAEAGAATLRVPENGEAILDVGTASSGRIRMWAIVPGPWGWRVKDENATSLGVLIRFERGAHIWSMLSLGDMVPKNALPTIRSVLSDHHGDGPVDVLKVSHHGSSNNVMKGLERVVGRKTFVMSSGWTNSPPSSLIQFYQASRAEAIDAHHKATKRRETAKSQLDFVSGQLALAKTEKQRKEAEKTEQTAKQALEEAEKQLTETSAGLEGDNRRLVITTAMEEHELVSAFKGAAQDALVATWLRDEGGFFVDHSWTWTTSGMVGRPGNQVLKRWIDEARSKASTTKGRRARRAAALGQGKASSPPSKKRRKDKSTSKSKS